MKGGNDNNVNSIGEKVYLQIDWIRHGFSCSNALGSLDANTVWSIISSWEFKRGKYAKDARLTDIGMAQARVANKKFFKRYEKFDMICCSQLRRAMETAELLFAGIHKDIYVLPYVCEVRHLIGKVTGLNNQTVPTDWMQRRAEVANKFNWMFFETLKIDGYAEASVDNFYKRLLPLMVYMLKRRKEGGPLRDLGTSRRPIRIAIVSHQRYMRRVMDIKPKIGNTGIWAEQMIYNMKKKAVDNVLGQKELYKPEYIVFNGKKVMYTEDIIEAKYLDKKSIERCDILEVIDTKKLRRGGGVSGKGKKKVVKGKKRKKKSKSIVTKK